MTAKKKRDGKESTIKLRTEAEKKVARSSGKASPLKKHDLDKLVHELQVHQVELEMQNEELRRAQEQLQVSKEQYFDLYDIAPVGYFSLNEAGIILEANLTGANMLGVVPRDLRARRLSSLIFKADQDVYYQHRHQLFTTRAPQLCELRMVRKDGSLFWARIEATLAKDAKRGKTVCLATMSDTTRQKQAELALSRQLDRAQGYLDTVETIIVALDSEGRITSINRKGCQLFECREDELIGQLWFSTCLPQPDGMEKVYPVFLKLIAGELEAAEYFENPIVTRGGEIRQVAWHNALLRDEQDRIIGTLSSGDDITQLKQMHEALLASEEKYRTIADFTYDWEYWLSPEGSYIYVSTSCKEITGYGPEAFMQDPDLMLKLIHPDDRDTLLRHRKEDPDHDEKYKSLDFRIITSGGDERWIGHRCRKVYGLDGNYLGKRGTNRDITERRLEHIALQKRNKEQKCIFSISSLSEAPDISVEKLLNRAVTLIPPGMQFTEVTEARITLEGRAVQTALFHETPWMMASNIIIAGKTAGQLEVCYLEEQPAEDEGPFLKEERQLIDAIASRLAHMISRIRSEEALQLSEANYRNLIENAGEGICVIQDGLFKFVNRALAATAGLPVDEMTNKLFTDYVHPDDREMIVERESRRVSGEKFDGSYSFRALNKERQTRWLTLSAVLITWEGKPATLNFLQDVTERKEFVEALRKSEDQYRWLSEHVTDGVWMLDMNLKPTHQSLSMEKLTGFTHKELMELPIEQRVTPESLKLAADLFFELMPGIMADPEYNPTHILELEYYRKDGSTLWTENKLSGTRDKNGKPLSIMAEVRDITERKRAEEALRESEELFRVAQEMSPDGFTILHPLRNEKGEIIDFTWVYENKTIARINGTDPEEVKGKRMLDLFPTHKGTSIFETYIYVSNSGKPQIIEEVYVGEIVSRPTWLRLVVVSIGEDIAILAQDITDRKKADEALQQRDAQYRLLADHTQDMVWLMDMNLKSVYLSPSTEKISGFTLQERMELTMEQSLTPESLKLASDLFLKELPSVEADPDYNLIHTLELEYYCKDGTTVWTEDTFSVIRDESGKPAFILGEARDISERKLSEEKLLKSYESLKKTLSDAINTMIKIVELRDPYTAGHQQRVADLAVAIAGEMKFEDEQIDQLRMAATIHDIGKIYVPSDILSKPGKLGDIELSLIRTHAQGGYDIVKGMDFPGAVAETILQHHERLDGSGYPNGLKAEDTLMKAKILAVADVVEAMASHRPYRPALGIDRALEEISKNRGILYAPDVVDVCLELFTEKGFKFAG